MRITIKSFKESSRFTNKSIDDAINEIADENNCNVKILSDNDYRELEGRGYNDFDFGRRFNKSIEGKLKDDLVELSRYYKLLYTIPEDLGQDIILFSQR